MVYMENSIWGPNGAKLDPYRAPMWVQHGTLLQIPHHSHMGSPYWTHIETHLGPIWVQHALLAGNELAMENNYMGGSGSATIK